MTPFIGDRQLLDAILRIRLLGSYAVEAGRVILNQCRGVRKPRRVRRERLISDDEYLKVYAVAGIAVRAAMVLAIRTLALPADLLGLVAIE